MHDTHAHDSRMSPEKASAEKASAEKASPEKTNPEKVSAEKGCVERENRETANPEKGSLETVGPETVSAEQVLGRLRLPVQTARLTLRQARADDVDAVWDYRGLPEVSRWMTLGGDRDTFIARFTDPGALADSLLIFRGDELIGDLRISVEDAWGQPEIAERARATQAELGWCIAPQYAGQGFATEAASELLRICFTQLGLRRVTASCFADNRPSKRLMERLGMRQEGHGRHDSLHRSWQWLDGAYYALLADEWKAQQRSEGHGR